MSQALHTSAVRQPRPCRSQVAIAIDLALNCRSVSVDLPFLGCNECIKDADDFLLGSSGIRQTSFDLNPVTNSLHLVLES